MTSEDSARRIACAKHEKVRTFACLPCTDDLCWTMNS